MAQGRRVRRRPLPPSSEPQLAGTFGGQGRPDLVVVQSQFVMSFLPNLSCGRCYANCDASAAPPVLSAADFSCFLSRFASGDPAANCDQSTTPPVLNALDFLCFLSKFAAGCS